MHLVTPYLTYEFFLMDQENHFEGVNPRQGLREKWVVSKYKYQIIRQLYAFNVDPFVFCIVQ